MAKPLINISSRQAYIYAAFLVLYEFLTYIANDMIMPGMIKVVDTFHGRESDVATSLTAYILGGASLQLFLGPLSDRFGRRPVMICGAFLFLFCTLVIASSQTMNQFLIARFLQGMGLCFIGVIGYATLQEIFEEMDAIRLFAIMANVSILAPLIGPLLGALIVNYFSWRYIFIAISVFAVLAAWGFWRFMPEPVGKMKRDGQRIKRVSLSPQVVFTNYWKLLSNKTFLLASIALGIVCAPCVAWIALAPVILIAEAKLTVIQYGLLQIPIFTAAVVGNWYLHHLTKKEKSLFGMIVFGLLFSCVSLFLICIVPLIFTGSYIYLLPGLLAYFFGLSLTVSPLDRYILFCTSVAKGTASALMTMIAMSVQALEVELANKLYAGHSNIVFGIYCAANAVLLLLILSVLYRKRNVVSTRSG